jgi:formylglycine-generating enzyme required for sulfatase activity
MNGKHSRYRKTSRYLRPWAWIALVGAWFTCTLVTSCVSPSSTTNQSLESVSEIPAAAETAPQEPLGFEPIAQNADWEPITQEFGGVPMALVPAGCFMTGSEEGDEDEQPVHQNCFDEPFWIDVYEVSNGQFRELGGEAWFESDWEGEEHPRENITWFEASAFCTLRGARLPTEAEWEYAARGPDGLVFPWGNSFSGAALNFCDLHCLWAVENSTVNDGYVESAPVGTYPDGISWVGAYDMSGNVREWISSIYIPYPYDAHDGREATGESDSGSWRVRRGGSWYDAEYNLRGATRQPLFPDGRHNNTGFRCARPYDAP